MENQNVRKPVSDARLKMAIEEYKSFNNRVMVSMMNDVFKTNTSFQCVVMRYRLLLRKYMTTFDERFVKVFEEYKALYADNCVNVFYRSIPVESLHFEFNFKVED